MNARHLPWIALASFASAIAAFFTIQAVGATSPRPFAFAVLSMFAAMPLLAASGIIAGALVVRWAVGTPSER